MSAHKDTSNQIIYCIGIISKESLLACQLIWTPNRGKETNKKAAKEVVAVDVAKAWVMVEVSAKKKYISLIICRGSNNTSKSSFQGLVKDGALKDKLIVFKTQADDQNSHYCILLHRTRVEIPTYYYYH